jgi:hypothetical protein
MYCGQVAPFSKSGGLADVCDKLGVRQPEIARHRAKQGKAVDQTRDMLIVVDVCSCRLRYRGWGIAS